MSISDKLIGHPKYKKINTLSISTGVVTVDLSLISNKYYLFLSSPVTSWVFTNLPPTNHVCDIEIIVEQDPVTANSCVTPAGNVGDITFGGSWSASMVLGVVELLGAQIYDDGVVFLIPSGPGA
jgi:hypothetical protein